MSDSSITDAVTVAAKQPRLLPAWETFKRAFGMWRMHWKVFTGIQILWGAAFLAGVIVALLSVGATLGTLGLLEGAPDPAVLMARLVAAPFHIVVLGVIALVFAAFVLVLTSWMSLATTQAWQWVAREEHASMSVRNAYAQTWSLVPTYMWVTILAGLLVAFGYLGFVVPGIMLSFAFAVLVPVVIAERARGRKAIMRATRLAQPFLLYIFWRVLLTGVVLYLPGTIVRWILNQMSGGLGDAFEQFYGLVVGPILPGVGYLTYLELKQHEKTDRIERWLSLERIALIGAAIAALLIVGLLVAGKL